MRDANRIDRICEELKTYWKLVPDWRFLQLVNNLLAFINCGDGFYVEDDKFEEKLMEFFKPLEDFD